MAFSDLIIHLHISLYSFSYEHLLQRIKHFNFSDSGFGLLTTVEKRLALGRLAHFAESSSLIQAEPLPNGRPLASFFEVWRNSKIIHRPSAMRLPCYRKSLLNRPLVGPITILENGAPVKHVRAPLHDNFDFVVVKFMDSEPFKGKLLFSLTERIPLQHGPVTNALEIFTHFYFGESMLVHHDREFDFGEFVNQNLRSIHSYYGAIICNAFWKAGDSLSCVYDQDEPITFFAQIKLFVALNFQDPLTGSTYFCVFMYILCHCVKSITIYELSYVLSYHANISYAYTYINIYEHCRRSHFRLTYLRVHTFRFPFDIGLRLNTFFFIYLRCCS